MAAREMLRRILAPRAALQDLGLLIVRLGFGLSLAIGHGLGKLPPSERFVNGVAEMGFPSPGLFAWGAALSESLGGSLIALGFLTRPAAFFALVTMVVALVLRHAADPFERKEKALLYALVMLALVLGGAGRYSVDALLTRRKS